MLVDVQHHVSFRCAYLAQQLPGDYQIFIKMSILAYRVQYICEFVVSRVISHKAESMGWLFLDKKPCVFQDKDRLLSMAIMTRTFLSCIKSICNIQFHFIPIFLIAMHTEVSIIRALGPTYTFSHILCVFCSINGQVSVIWRNRNINVSAPLHQRFFVSLVIQVPYYVVFSRIYSLIYSYLCQNSIYTSI